MHVGSLEASAVLGLEVCGLATWRGSGKIMVGKTQRAALPLAARCNYGCSALHLKSGCSADSWGIGQASFSQRFPLLLSSFSVFFSALFRIFSHSFPFLLPLRSARLCPALPPSSYCMAKPCRLMCHAGLCCLARPRQRTCALWDGLMSCVGRGAQYWNV